MSYATMTNEQIRELGHTRGYAAANYAINVSGESLADLKPAEQPADMSPEQWMYYVDGFDNGIEECERDDSEE